ncbi:MAG: LL-diaminopimelate aminotransferase [Clostridiales bacterium]|nr:LL-diaminopimelate aminotransferase [Clostridiales bacterium]
MHINSNYKNISETYLFSEIAQRVKKFSEQNPDAQIIRMGIGDVTRPLCSSAVNALKKAADEMGTKDGFKGYGPEQGYDFLKQALADYYKTTSGVALELDEIFVSDGAKSDLGNILDIFSDDNVVAVTDPVYPVYVDTNTMAGRKIVYLPANKDNGFLPMPSPDLEADIIYLCSPNNPTGAAYTKDQLKVWIDYALSRDAVILFDCAYEAFVTDPKVPRSIFAVEGAKKCAIEFCSFSKTAGFTGTRCGYTVVPNDLIREGMKLQKMWLRRQTTKFNGVSYPVQCAAAACLSKTGLEEIASNLEYYKYNADVITSTFDELGWPYTGGKNSPYVWVKCPDGLSSWDFFDALLTKANVVGTPGAGFGQNGEGFLRLTSFNTHGNTMEAMRRIKEVFK